MDSVSLDTTSTSASPTAPSSPSPTITDREQIKIEFYRTYDVMTGVRIAATLGGFFGLMVILVVYKSKSKTEKVLTNPQLAAAVVEAEEERQLNAALEATAEYRILNPRRSLGNTSAPCGPRYMRFSSVGNRSSLLTPTVITRPQHRFLLDVPGGGTKIARRPSNHTTTTCSSSESSYLERRDSAVALSPSMHEHRARRRTSSPIPWDLYYPIDIRVIQPTPGGSPCGSERTLHAAAHKLAPLASISSCASSLVVDYPDLDARSLGSDSVFLDDDECLDTDDEVTQFSTDSDTDTLSGCPTTTQYQLPMSDFLRKAPSTSGDIEEGSWSQETLF